ncbi:MAG: helix-turn-helix domain-containing protein, partial [Christensenellales bacterium]
MDRITQEAHHRQRMMKYLQKHGVTETAMRYKTSRKTVIKWRKRWDGTVDSLKDRSRRPHRSPRKHSDEEIRAIRKVLKKHHWNDLLLTYQVLLERYGYMRS